jgi:hypothetical protein
MPPPSQREGDRSEQARHHFVLFWSDPAHEWYHHCDMAKQTAIQRTATRVRGYTRRPHSKSRTDDRIDQVLEY